MRPVVTIALCIVGAAVVEVMALGAVHLVRERFHATLVRVMMQRDLAYERRWRELRAGLEHEHRRQVLADEHVQRAAYADTLKAMDQLERDA